MTDTRTVMMASVLLLVTVGAVMVFSTTVSGFSDLWNWRVWLQYAWLVLGVAGMFAMMRVPFERLWRLRWIIAIVTAGMLLAVFVPGVGTKVNGAYRWLRVGPVTFQPSEVAKLSLILIAADLLSRKKTDSMQDLRRFGLTVAVTAVLAGLVMIEPDFGTACLLAALGAVIMFVAGVRWRFLLPAAATGVAGGALLVLISPYRLRRFTAFLDWREHLTDKGYHIHQSLIALGSGGVTGVGLGGSQQKLSFLPEAHNDFIFSIIGEELGLIGALGVLALFLIFFLCGMRTFRALADRRKALVAAGITLAITLQALMNIAVVTATVPTKGIALPFVSKGGSSLVLSLISVGILLGLTPTASRAGPPKRETPPE